VPPEYIIPPWTWCPTYSPPYSTSSFFNILKIDVLPYPLEIYRGSIKNRGGEGGGGVSGLPTMLEWKYSYPTYDALGGPLEV